MRKFVLAIFFALVAPVLVQAQALPSSDKELLELIAGKSASLSSFSADFIQEREVTILTDKQISRGHIQYRNDGRILWRYDSPSSYQMAFTTEDIRITRDGKTEVTSLSENPLMAQLRKLLLGVMSGEKITETDGFDVTVQRGAKEIVMSLVPKQRQLRKLFSSMEMRFTTADLLVSGIVMNEPDGSSTSITFTNRKAEQ